MEFYVVRECVCVRCHPIYSGRQAYGRTSRGHTRGKGHTGFLHLPSAVLALIFLARRVQLFLSLVNREVEFGVLTNLSFSICSAFFIFIFIFVGKKTVCTYSLPW